MGLSNKSQAAAIALSSGLGVDTYIATSLAPENIKVETECRLIFNEVL